MRTKAVYAGSFAPFHKGHLHIYNQAIELFDEVTVVIAVNPLKKQLFDPATLAKSIAKVIGNENVHYYPGLIAEYCKNHGVTHLVRGLRNTSDYAYEEQVAKINEDIYPKLKTIYLRAENSVISSSYIRILQENNQWELINNHVPIEIFNLLKGVANPSNDLKKDNIK